MNPIIKNTSWNIIDFKLGKDKYESIKFLDNSILNVDDELDGSWKLSNKALEFCFLNYNFIGYVISDFIKGEIIEDSSNCQFFAQLNSFSLPNPYFRSINGELKEGYGLKSDLIDEVFIGLMNVNIDFVLLNNVSRDIIERFIDQYDDLNILKEITHSLRNGELTNRYVDKLYSYCHQHPIDLKFIFPLQFSFGILVNDFIHLAKSEFFNTYLKKSKKHTSIIHNGKNVDRFVLSKDIWGAKEIFLYIENENDYDVFITYSSRNEHDLINFQNYLHSNLNFIEAKEGNMFIYKFHNPTKIWPKILDLVITLRRLNSQHYEMNLLVNVNEIIS